MDLAVADAVAILHNCNFVGYAGLKGHSGQGDMDLTPLQAQPPPMQPLPAPRGGPSGGKMERLWASLQAPAKGTLRPADSALLGDQATHALPSMQTCKSAVIAGSR